MSFACWDYGFESCRIMDICCECRVLLSRGLCVVLITRPEESYRLCCVVVCDLETSWMRRPWPSGGGACCSMGGKNRLYVCFVWWKILGAYIQTVMWVTKYKTCFNAIFSLRNLRHRQNIQVLVFSLYPSSPFSFLLAFFYNFNFLLSHIPPSIPLSSWIHLYNTVKPA